MSGIGSGPGLKPLTLSLIIQEIGANWVLKSCEVSRKKILPKSGRLGND